MFCVKKFRTNLGVILAVCDEELIGKELWFGDNKFEVSETFYCGEKIRTEEELAVLLLEAISLNILGNRAVRLALKLGLVHEESIMYFDSEGGKVAYAIVQVMRF